MIALTPPAPPAQLTSVQAPPVQALLALPIQAFSASVPLAANEPGRKQHGKHLEQVHIASPSDIYFPMDKYTNNDTDAQLSQYAASGQKEIPGLFEKSRLVKQADNKKDKKLVLTQLPTMQRRAYIQSTSDFNRDFYIRPPRKPISLLGDSSDSNVKAIKPLHDVSKASINRIAIYHPHYKNKFSNLTWSFVFATDYLHSLCSLSHLSAAPACASEQGLVTKKVEPPRTSLHLLSHSLQPLSFFLSSMLSEYAVMSKRQPSSTLSEMRLAIPKCSAMFKVAAMFKYNALSKWELSLTLAGFPSLADYSSVKLTSEETIKAVEDRKYLTSTQTLPEASFDFSRAAHTAKLSPDNDTISYVICLANTTNKANVDLFSIKCKRVTRDVLAAKVYAMAHELAIEKQKWGRSQIVRTKSNQYQHYGIQVKRANTNRQSMKRARTERASTGI